MVKFIVCKLNFDFLNEMVTHDLSNYPNFTFFLLAHLHFQQLAHTKYLQVVL